MQYLILFLLLTITCSSLLLAATNKRKFPFKVWIVGVVSLFFAAGTTILHYVAILAARSFGLL